MPKTPLRNFRCDDERWGLFLALCRDVNTDASAQIREMIDQFLDAKGIAPPADSFSYPGQ